MVLPCLLIGTPCLATCSRSLLDAVPEVCSTAVSFGVWSDVWRAMMYSKHRLGMFCYGSPKFCYHSVKSAADDHLYFFKATFHRKWVPFNRRPAKGQNMNVIFNTQTLAARLVGDLKNSGSSNAEVNESDVDKYKE